MFMCVWNKTSSALWVGPLYKFPGVDFVCMHTAFIIFIYLHLSSSSSSVSCAGVWFYAHMCRNMRPRLSCDFPSVFQLSLHTTYGTCRFVWTCWIRQLAYFQLNIEMCLPSYFPLSNVWIINVPENREQSKQLWGLESLFNLLFQTERQLNAVWTETGKKQLALQRLEATPVEASHLKQKEWNWTCPPGRHGFFTADWSWS